MSTKLLMRLTPFPGDEQKAGPSFSSPSIDDVGSNGVELTALESDAAPTPSVSSAQSLRLLVAEEDGRAFGETVRKTVDMGYGESNAGPALEVSRTRGSAHGKSHIGPLSHPLLRCFSCCDVFRRLTGECIA